MDLRKTQFGNPYAIEATAADGPVAEVFGPSATVVGWFEGGGDGYVGTYDGQAVVVSREDFAALASRHGLVGGY